MDQPIFDTHALAVSQDTARYPHSPLGGQPSAWSGERAVTAGQIVAAMDEAGITRTLLLQSSTTYGFNNDYLADAVAAHRDRLCGMFSINVLEADAPRQMRHLRDRGLAGLRIFTHGSTIKQAWLALDDPRAAPAWRCAEELRMPVATNCADLAQVEVISRSYPGMPLVLEHVTRPQIKEGPPYGGIQDLLALSRYKNLFLKITPRTLTVARQGRASAESYLEKLIADFGSARLLWGSYYPPTPLSLTEIVADVKTVLSPFLTSDRNNILWQTASELFGTTE